VGVGYLQDVVEDDVAEALACGGQDVGGLLHLVLLVARCLGVPDERRLLLLAHLVKLLLGLLELAQVSGGGGRTGPVGAIRAVAQYVLKQWF